MPFIKQRYFVHTPIRAQIFLMRYLHYTPKTAQRLIAKSRFYENDEYITKPSQIISGDITIVVFKGVTRGLKPIYENKYFALFEKPNDLLVHPKNIFTEYSLLDEIKYYLGKEACLAHRIDFATSGLVLVSKAKKYEQEIKELFEERTIQKTYEVVVEGEIKEKITINKPLKKNSDINSKEKVIVHKYGRVAITDISPIKYDKLSNTTKIYAKPKTGRMHQIRVHLNSIGHRIVGDPLYGVSFEISDKYLDNKLTNEDKIKYLGANRLMLHAKQLDFDFKDKTFSLKSEESL